MSKTITIPGAVDLHVHFREPGNNKAETIRSGSKAALLGGYVFVCDMPNNPGNPTWTEEKMLEKQGAIKRSSYIPMATYAGAQPESDNLLELPKMAGKSIGLKLYGAPTTGNEKDYTALDFVEIVKLWHEIAPKKPIMLHAGKNNLEDMIRLVARDHDHHIHICHVNSVRDVKIVNKFKKRGCPVSCGVCPHHLVKSSFDTSSEGWFARMQPPLAHQDEADELLDMLASGMIDVVETDHAPHPEENKWKAEVENPEGTHEPGQAACFGVPGIEFALPLLFYQMKRGRLTLEQIIEATSIKPAKIAGVKLSPRTKVTWRMDEYRIGEEYPKGMSGSGWTPFMDKLAVGKPEKVVVGGKALMEDGKFIEKLPRVIERGAKL
jgi:dihydroorotase